MTDSIKSKAGHVLSTSDDPEAKSLAASVLSQAAHEDDAPAQTASGRMMEQRHETRERSLAEMRALLRKIDGREGMRERADVLRGMIRDAEGVAPA